MRVNPRTPGETYPMPSSPRAPAPRPDSALRVAIDATPLLAPRTGIGHFAAELLTVLEDPGPPGEPRVDVVRYVVSRRAGVTGSTVRLPVPAGMAVRLWGTLGWPACDRRLGDAQVIHGTNFIAPPSRRRAVVVTVHDVAFARYPELCSPRARAAGKVAARLAGRGAWIHTPTEYVADEVRELFSTERVRATPHGIPTLPRPGGRSDTVPDGPFLLTLGTLEPRKRHALLVTAFGRVADAHPDLRLVLAGPDGAARPDVDSAIAALPSHARERVMVTGHVDDGTRAALLRGATIFVYPSLYEGFGLPVLEAMSLGTVVIAAESGGVAECAGGAAVLVEGSVDALADALGRVLTDAGLREQLSDAGLRRAREFSWARTGQAMIRLYTEAAKSHE